MYCFVGAHEPNGAKINYDKISTYSCADDECVLSPADVEPAVPPSPRRDGPAPPLSSLPRDGRRRAFRMEWMLDGARWGFAGPHGGDRDEDGQERDKEHVEVRMLWL